MSTRETRLWPRGRVSDEPAGDRYLTASPIADLASCSRDLVRYWARTKRLRPHLVTSTGLQIFRLRPVVALLLEREFTRSWRATRRGSHGP